MTWGKTRLCEKTQNRKEGKKYWLPPLWAVSFLVPRSNPHPVPPQIFHPVPLFLFRLRINDNVTYYTCYLCSFLLLYAPVKFLFFKHHIGLYKSWLGFVIEFEGGYIDLLTILGQKKETTTRHSWEEEFLVSSNIKERISRLILKGVRNACERFLFGI